MTLLAMMSAAALLAAAQSGAAAAPAAAAPKEAATEVESVVVTAAPRETISEFVRSISDPVRRGGKLARWNRTICPATLGLQRDYAQYMNDRVASVAMGAGLKVAKPGCTPDILIIVSADTPTLLAEMAEDHKDLFATRRWSYERTNSGGSQTFERFIQSDRPVRWWHVSETVPADGRGFGADDKTVRVEGTRVRATMREDFAFVIIVVDARQAEGIGYQALADYVAMASLAQLNPDVNSAQVPTILNLFDRKGAADQPEGLTDWDKAYLKGLYTARNDAPDARSQRGRIISGVRKGGFQ